jgi:hypothetical protein
MIYNGEITDDPLNETGSTIDIGMGITGIQFEFETENEADKFAKAFVERKKVVAASVSFNYESKKWIVDGVKKAEIDMIPKKYQIAKIVINEMLKDAASSLGSIKKFFCLQKSLWEFIMMISIVL